VCDDEEDLMRLHTPYHCSCSLTHKLWLCFCKFEPLYTVWAIRCRVVSLGHGLLVAHSELSSRSSTCSMHWARLTLSETSDGLMPETLDCIVGGSRSLKRHSTPLVVKLALSLQVSRLDSSNQVGTVDDS
jgi:hypothetical protein